MPAFKVNTDMMSEAYFEMLAQSRDLRECTYEVNQIIYALKQEKPLDEICNRISQIVEKLRDNVEAERNFAETLNGVIPLFMQCEKTLTNN